MEEGVGGDLLIACEGADKSIKLNTWHTQSTETNPQRTRAQIRARLGSDMSWTEFIFGCC